MKYTKLIYLFCTILFLSACSSKQNLNLDEINSISLNNNILVVGVPLSTPSPVSFGIGFGGMASSNLGIGVNSIFNPTIPNTQDLKLQDSFYRNNISFEKLIENEFKSQMQNDEIFKDKFVQFGSDYIIYLFVPNYSLKTQLFSSKVQLKLDLEIKILNKNNQLIYQNSKDNILFSNNYIYSEDEILYSKDALIQTANLAIKQVIARLILEIKKDGKKENKTKD